MAGMWLTTEKYSSEERFLKKQGTFWGYPPLRVLASPKSLSK
ncbi:hypothetical protein [uncultured Veillonella sp.]|nr:hypothetical protein [uncultured Veillonella sp.]